MLDVNIASLRKMRRLTQSDLAKALDLDVSTISRWERGESGPPTTGDALANLAKALKCQVWQLFHPDPIVAGRAEKLRLGSPPGYDDDEPVDDGFVPPETKWAKIARERAERGITHAEALEERYESRFIS